MVDNLKSYLKGKVVILGVGNTLRSDDAAGVVLAARIKEKSPYIVYDSGVSPENYLGKIIKDNPDTVVIIDSADFGGLPGEIKILAAEEIRAVNLFTTHNASLSMVSNYLQNNLKADIIILIIQPKSIVLGGGLSFEVQRSIEELEGSFCGKAE